MRTYFCNGLTDQQMRLSVSKSRPKSLADALAYATEYESIVQAVSADTRSEKKWTRQARPEEEERIEGIQKQVAELAAHLRNLTEQRTAPYRGQPQPPRPYPKRTLPPRRSREDVVCYNCQRKGHYARECPVPARREPPSARAAPTNTATARAAPMMATPPAAVMPTPPPAQATTTILADTQRTAELMTDRSSSNSSGSRQ